jgi:hypothetical protein
MGFAHSLPAIILTLDSSRNLESPISPSGLFGKNYTVEIVPHFGKWASNSHRQLATDFVIPVMANCVSEPDRGKEPLLILLATNRWVHFWGITQSAR